MRVKAGLSGAISEKNKIQKKSRGPSIKPIFCVYILVGSGLVIFIKIQNEVVAKIRVLHLLILALKYNFYTDNDQNISSNNSA